MRIVILLCCFYFMYIEWVSVLRDGLGYLKDPFNYVDFLIFLLNFIIIGTATHIGSDASDLTREERMEERATHRYISAILVVLLWFKAFYWLRMFHQTSFYIKLIIETISDLKYFLILFIFSLLTFGNALLVLN